MQEKRNQCAKDNKIKNNQKAKRLKTKGDIFFWEHKNTKQ